MATMKERIAERYPSLLPLLRIPEMNNLLTQAVTQNWSPGQFQSQLIASHWFRSQSASQRQWWVTSATDPGEAQQQRSLMQQQIAARARQLGISPTLAELSSIRENALRLGLTGDQLNFWATNALVKLAGKGGRTDVGAWTTTATAIRQMSNGEYYWPVPDHVNKKWTTWITTGQRTMEDYQAVLQREAMARYPHMAERLKAGETVNDIIGPMRQLVAEELELNGPGAVDLSNPRYRQLLGVRDPKTQQMRMLTESEVLKLAREDDRWGATSKGRATQYSMVRALMEQMGNRKF